jgi:alpha-ketoglutarate-dependent taurine dioxygenase
MAAALAHRKGFPTMAIAATHVKPLIGSILHVDRSRLLTDEVVAECLRLLEDRGVVVFPRIGVSDAEQLAFTDRLGARVNFTRSVPGGDAETPGVYRITLDPRANPEPEYVQGTFFWHMDGLLSDIPPPKATLLSARRVAPRGGQTEFASTLRAWEHLPEADKQELEGLRAVHSMRAALRGVIDRPTPGDVERWSRSPDREHPLVWKQRSGRRSLIVGYTADHIASLPHPDGRALLARLLEWTAQPDFVYRHEWQEGDLVVWNNCGALHRVIPYRVDSGRTMHRTSVSGVEHVS